MSAPFRLCVGNPQGAPPALRGSGRVVAARSPLRKLPVLLLLGVRLGSFLAGTVQENQAGNGHDREHYDYDVIKSYRHNSSDFGFAKENCASGCYDRASAGGERGEVPLKSGRVECVSGPMSAPSRKQPGPGFGS